MAALATVLLTVPIAHATPQDIAFRLHGDGNQVYRCESTDGASAWRLIGPDAVLRDANGLVAIRHGAGPHWTAGDGSTVYGMVVTTIPAPDPGAIAWLVLRASRHEGAGLLSRVAFVLRTDTQGGLPPAGGCGERDVGAEVRSHYTATYTFVPTLPGAQASLR